ncbi:MAG: Swt1 family HEPN domain-containing protein [Spirulinaceae cyanobacterium]
MQEAETLKQAKCGLTLFLKKECQKQIDKVVEINFIDSSTLHCKIKCKSKLTSVDSKVILCFSMPFLMSFLEDADIERYAVSLLDAQECTFMYAISSASAVKSASRGESIEWLNGTVLEDTTDLHLLQVAKNIVSTTERTLRDFVHEVMQLSHGQEWWQENVPDKIRTGVSKITKKKKLAERELLEHTYIHHLKDIILHNWSHFESSLAPKVEFEETMKSFNVLRREEAHNRLLDQDYIEKLKGIQGKLFSGIAKNHPHLVDNLLSNDWKLKVGEIIENYSNWYARQKMERNNLQQVLLVYERMCEELKSVSDQINSIYTPPSCYGRKEEVSYLFMNLRRSFLRMMNCVQKNNLDSLREAVKDNQRISNRFTSLKEQVLWEK